MINIGMAVSFNIEGQAYSFPDWSTESTSKQMVDILTEIAKANGVSGKALAELKKTLDSVLIYGMFMTLCILISIKFHI